MVLKKRSFNIVFKSMRILFTNIRVRIPYQCPGNSRKGNLLKFKTQLLKANSWIIVGLGLSNESRRYDVTSSPTGSAHTQNNPW